MATGRRAILDRVRAGLRDWSVPRQLRGADALGKAAESADSRRIRPRLEEADRVGASICPYCAVGCGQLIYARGDEIIHVEGDPRSPINRGTLCPKGAATFGWLSNPNRLTTVKYRAPGARQWEEKPLDWAMERIAQLIKQTRDETFVRALPDGTTVNHTLGTRRTRRRYAGQRRELPDQEASRRGIGDRPIENQARI